MKIQIGDELRDMSDDEKTNYDAVKREAAAHLAAIESIAAAKVSARVKLKALGLTDDEIAALAG